MFQIRREDFEKVDVRIGSVIEAEQFPEARVPSIKLAVDFGTGGWSQEEQRPAHGALLAGDAPWAAGGGGGERTSESCSGFKSEVLVLGVPDEEGAVVLLAPDREVSPGSRMY